MELLQKMTNNDELEKMAEEFELNYEIIPDPKDQILQYPKLSISEQGIARVWYIRGACDQQKILCQQLASQAAKAEKLVEAFSKIQLDMCKHWDGETYDSFCEIVNESGMEEALKSWRTP